MPVKRKSSRNGSKLSRNVKITQKRPKRSKRSKRASQKKRGRKASKRQRGGGDYFDKVATRGYGHKARGSPKHEGDADCKQDEYGSRPSECEQKRLTKNGKYLGNIWVKKKGGLFSGLSGLLTGN